MRLAGILRKVGYETLGTADNEPKGHEIGWGLDLTGRSRSRSRRFKLGAVYGAGIATYMNDGGMDLAPVASRPIPVPADGIILVPQRRGREAVRHVGLRRPPLVEALDLVDRLQLRPRSTTPTSRTPTAFHKGEYASVNLLWTPADNVMTGARAAVGQAHRQRRQHGRRPAPAVQLQLGLLEQEPVERLRLSKVSRRGPGSSCAASSERDRQAPSGCRFSIRL